MVCHREALASNSVPNGQSTRNFLRTIAVITIISRGTAFMRSPVNTRIQHGSQSRLLYDHFMNKARSYETVPLSASTLEDTEQTELVDNIDLMATPSQNKQYRRSNAVKMKPAADLKSSLTSQNVSKDSSTPDKIRSARSRQRMFKAQKLLEMAQISPSQRLEMEEERLLASRSADSTSASIKSRSKPASSANHLNSTQDVYQMRMAGTFDSVDNLVDSKSLLPGGRWTDPMVDLTKNDSPKSNEKEIRNKVATGKVAEVCCVLSDQSFVITLQN